MNKLIIGLESTTVPDHNVETMTQQLRPVTEQLEAAADDPSYRSMYAFMFTPFDEKALQAVEQFAPLKAMNPDVIILIGIGGSNLATLAVVQALNGCMNGKQNIPALYMADTVNQRLTHDLLSQTECWLKEGKRVVILVTSKSGKTLETLVNAALFIDVLQKYDANYRQHIVILSELNSPLHTYAHTEQILFCPVPETVPGRYSIFTTTHLLPLYLMHVDIKALCNGAHTDVLHASAQSASVLYYLSKQGVAIHDLFIFDPYLETLGKWYRQLLAESIGKRTSLEGKKIEVGITPTVSIGSTDLHSIAQLYLAGPHNRFITFIYNTLYQSDVTIEHPYSFLPPYVQNKNIAQVEHALITGTIEAFKHEHRPYMTITLKEMSPEMLGEFFYFMMTQMVYLGALFAINPFDQPEVELYKTVTKRCLEHGC